MRVLVCGGRNYSNRLRAYRVLDGYNDRMDALITGAAAGADQLATEWLADRDLFKTINARRYPADWKRLGKAAGPIRNQQMIDEEQPDLVVAFPGGKGTADMVRRARAANIEVVEIT